jgi:hypothetical protein
MRPDFSADKLEYNKWRSGRRGQRSCAGGLRVPNALEPELAVLTPELVELLAFRRRRAIATRYEDALRDIIKRKAAGEKITPASIPDRRRPRT